MPKDDSFLSEEQEDDDRISTREIPDDDDSLSDMQESSDRVTPEKLQKKVTFRLKIEEVTN